MFLGCVGHPRMTYQHAQEANTITLNAAISSCEESGAWQVALPGGAVGSMTGDDGPTKLWMG